MNKKGITLAVIIAILIAWIGLSTAPNPTIENSDVATKDPIIVTDMQNPFTENPTHMAIVQTSAGEVQIALYGTKAPKTVENFTKLSNEGFYNNTRFHRIIKDFMIQGGDPNTKGGENKTAGGPGSWGTGGPGYQFEDEIHGENQNAIGSISMANAGPGTNGSQFFINIADNGYLNSRHTVFGFVVEGMDIVKTLGEVLTNSGDQPIEDVVVKSISVEEVVV